MYKTFSDYIVIIISVIGGLASIVSFGKYFGAGLNYQGLVGVIFLGFFALFYFFYNIKLIFKFRKKVGYSDIFGDLSQAYSKLHTLRRKDNSKNRVDNIDDEIEKIIEFLKKFCTHISQAFTKLNGNNIGVCIKILEEGSNPRVVTIVRDDYSLEINGRKTGESDKTKHYLNQNSDFNYLYSNYDDSKIDTTHFYEGNLPIKMDYKNTQLKPDWASNLKIFLIENFLRRLKWPLKY